MQLTPHVENLRREFLLAAGSLGEDAASVAERLLTPLDSSLRLTLLEVLSRAADEISREMAPGFVDVRLRGIDPAFVVTIPPPPEAGGGVAPARADEAPLVATTVEDEHPTARINFRPPEHLKARIEEAASREGLSVNAWLVRFLSASLSGAARAAEPYPAGVDRHVTGWVR